MQPVTPVIAVAPVPAPARALLAAALRARPIAARIALFPRVLRARPRIPVRPRAFLPPLATPCTMPPLLLHALPPPLPALAGHTQPQVGAAAAGLALSWTVVACVAVLLVFSREGAFVSGLALGCVGGCVSVSIGAPRARSRIDIRSTHTMSSFAMHSFVDVSAASLMFQLLWDYRRVSPTVGVCCYLRGNSPFCSFSMGAVVDNCVAPRLREVCSPFFLLSWLLLLSWAL